MNIYVRIPESLISSIPAIRRRMREMLQTKCPSFVRVHISIPVETGNIEQNTIVVWSDSEHMTDPVVTFAKHLKTVMSDITKLRVVVESPSCHSLSV